VVGTETLKATLQGALKWTITFNHK